MINYVFTRLQNFKLRHSMGVIRDAHFVNCHWPHLDVPTEIFAPGSSGIVVMGSPAPRNVIFPAGTVFEEYFPDALFPAEQAVKQQFQGLVGLVNLNEAQAAVWIAAYDKAVLELPKAATKIQTASEVLFIRHRDDVAGSLVAPVSLITAKEIAAGSRTADSLKSSLDFVKIDESADSVKYKLTPNGPRFDVGVK